VRRLRRIAPWTVLLLLPAIAWTQERIDRALGSFRAQEESLYLWSGRHVKMMFPGFEGLMAGVYWLRTVQYFGGQRVFAQDKNFKLLDPLIEITTTLDPRLEIAYRYGATFLSEQRPVGAGRPADGVALLEKGARANPGSWRLRQELGFFTYLFLKDASRAAEILLEASEIPGSAFWLKAMAADILRKGGDRATSRLMWRRIMESAEPGPLKRNAEDRLRILDALDQADRLAAAAREFEKRAGRLPASLEELRASRLARDPVLDSSGMPFEYDASTGRVRVSRRSRVWRPD